MVFASLRSDPDAEDRPCHSEIATPTRRMRSTIARMDCHRVLEVLYLVADRDFDSAERHAFRVHLERCDPCRARSLFSSRVLHLVRERSPRQSAPESLRLRILSEFAHRQI